MTQNKSFLERSVHKCFEVTIVFDLVRKILHRNFFQEKRLLGRELDMNKKTLDFGCGSGPYSVIFPKEMYLGVDVDQKSIEFAKRKYNKQFVAINGKDLSAVNTKVEQIFAIDVFHHLPGESIKSYVKEFHHILTRNGRVLILEHFPVQEQTRMLGRLLLTFDRGKYIRDKKTLAEFFKKKFALKKTYDFYAASCRDYALLLQKKER